MNCRRKWVSQQKLCKALLNISPKKDSSRGWNFKRISIAKPTGAAGVANAPVTWDVPKKTYVEIMRVYFDYYDKMRYYRLSKRIWSINKKRPDICLKNNRQLKINRDFVKNDQ